MAADRCEFAAIGGIFGFATLIAAPADRLWDAVHTLAAQFCEFLGNPGLFGLFMPDHHVRDSSVKCPDDRLTVRFNTFRRNSVCPSFRRPTGSRPKPSRTTSFFRKASE
ncbi:hypothetical protein [Nocardia puris]|uniref:hypothetical protein n=1 Tax=Nocardia puris TaxID=208602 RepID=UPI001E513295|nr:hypothetical protein [Nocardia puris]